MEIINYPNFLIGTFPVKDFILYFQTIRYKKYFKVDYFN